jgi:hypothetical protein
MLVAFLQWPDDSIRQARSTSLLLILHSRPFFVPFVTDLQGPPLERTQKEKLMDLKKLAQRYARDWGSCDDKQISYLETLEERDDDNLRLAQMLAR